MTAENKPSIATIKKWKELTGNNCHTECLIAKAEWCYKHTNATGFERLIIALQYVDAEHNRIGHLPYELCIVRTCLMHDLHNLVEEYFPAAYAEIVAA